MSHVAIGHTLMPSIQSHRHAYRREGYSKVGSKNDPKENEKDNEKETVVLWVLHVAALGSAAFNYWILTKMREDEKSHGKWSPHSMVAAAGVVILLGAAGLAAYKAVTKEKEGDDDYLHMGDLEVN